MAVPLAISAVPVDAHAQDTQSTTEWKDVENLTTDWQLSHPSMIGQLTDINGATVGCYGGNSERKFTKVISGLEAGKKYRLLFPFAANIKVIVNNQEIGGIDHAGNFYRGTFDECKLTPDESFIKGDVTAPATIGWEFVAQEGTNELRIEVLHPADQTTPFKVKTVVAYKINPSANGAVIQRKDGGYSDIANVNVQAAYKELAWNNNKFWAFYPSLQVAEEQGGGEIVDPDDPEVPPTADMDAWQYYQDITGNQLKALEAVYTAFNKVNSEFKDQLGDKGDKLKTLADKAKSIYDDTLKGINCLKWSTEDKDHPNFSTKENYEKDMLAIGDAKAAINALNALQAALQSAVKDITEYGVISYAGYVKVDLDIAAKCDGKLSDILNKISALESYGEEDLAAVNSDIEALKTSAGELKAAAEEVKEKLTPVYEVYKSVQTLAASGRKASKEDVDKKLVSPNVDNDYAAMLADPENTTAAFVSYRSDLKSFQDTFEAPYQAAETAPFDECLAALNRLKEMDTYSAKWYGEYDLRLVATLISRDNLSTAKAERDRIALDLTNGETFDGQEGIQAELDAVTATLNSQENEISNAGNDTEGVELLKAIDTVIQEQIDSMKELQEKINAYRVADGLYNDLAKKLIDAGKNLALLQEKNAKEAGLAKDHFQTVIDELQKEMDALATVTTVEETSTVTGGEVKTAFDADKVEFVKKCEGENGFTNRVSALASGIKNTSDAIDANREINQKLLMLDEEVRLLNENRYKWLIALPEENQNLQAVQDWIKEIRQLLDVELKGLAEEVLETYMVAEFTKDKPGTNPAVTYEEDYRARYKALKDKIQTGPWSDEYMNSVQAKNEQTASGWSASLEILNNLYLQGIKKLNQYIYDLKNEGYSSTIYEAVNTIDLYRYREDIDNLAAAVQEFINNKNGNMKEITDDETGEVKEIAWPLVFTEAEFNEVADITDLRNRILSDTDRLVETAKSAAEKYYASLRGECERNIADQESLLVNEGIEAEKTRLGSLMEEFSNACEKEQNIHPVGTPEQTEDEYKDASDKYIMAMDEVANDLDKVKVQINLDDAAKAYWIIKYGEASENRKTAKELSEELKGFKAIEPEELNGYIEEFNTVCGELDAISGDWNGLAEGWFENYKDYSTRMDEKIRDLNNIVVKARQKNTDNSQVDEKQKDWTARVSTLRDELNLFKSHSAGLSAEDNLAGQVGYLEYRIANEIEAKIEGFTTWTNYAELERIEDQIRTAIQRCYGSFRNLEINELRDFIGTTCKIAYNDAQDATKGELADPMKGYNLRFNELDREIDEAGAYMDAFAEADEFRTKALAWEQEIADKCSELQKIGGKVNDVETSLKALDDKHLEVENALFDARENLNRYHASLKTADNYNAYDTFETRLEQLKGEWEADGSKVVLHKENYLSELDILINEVNSLKDQLDAENETAVREQTRRDTSDKRYGELLEEYNGLEKAVNDFETLIAGWERKTPGQQFDVMYWWQIDDLRYYLGYVKQDLEWRKENYDLKEDSQLINYGIASSLRDLKSDAYHEYAKDALAHAYNRQQALLETLTDNKIVAKVRRDIEEQKGSVDYSLGLLNSNHSWYDQDWMNGEEKDQLHQQVRDEALGYADRYDALATTASENTFVPGDVDGDGEVTVIDYQQLLALVGEAADYETLYAENAPKACAADTNDDFVLNVGDLAGMVNLLMGETPQQAFMSRMKAPAMNGENHLTLRLDSDENGVRRYAVVLDNADVFCNGQIDVKVSGNAAIANVALADRVKNHDLNRFDGEFGFERVILSSMENAVFNGNSGEILFIEIEGTGDVSVENVIFADRNARTYNLGEKGGTTLIDSIIEGAKSVKEGIYNAAGQAFDKIQRGINIIRHKDGKTTKEMHKK